MSSTDIPDRLSGGQPEVPEHLRWRLRLFISVDLVGSTALKQRGRLDAYDTTEWPFWFLTFYETFERRLHLAYDSMPRLAAALAGLVGKSNGQEPVERPRLWKRNGDELLLVTTLYDHREAIVHLSVLSQVLQEYHQHWADEREDLDEQVSKRGFPMDLKATAWVAGFPIGNIGVPRDMIEPLDFIDPQIDLGFRIAKCARRDRIVLDLWLALLVATAMANREKGEVEGFKLVYCGTEELRGVLEGLPYPVFAVEIPHPVDAARRRIEGSEAAEELAYPDVCQFVEAFVEHTHGIGLPFIDGDAHFGLDRLPIAGALRERRDRMVFDYQKETGGSAEADDDGTERESADLDSLKTLRRPGASDSLTSEADDHKPDTSSD